MINSRAIIDLHPHVADLCNNFKVECMKHDIDILITSTYRDHESQDAIYAQGRTKPGKRVTNARGGQSFHNWRVAFDFVPIINGKAQWSDIATFKKCGKIAKSIGLEWSGDWSGRMREYAHCQWTNGLTIKDFQAGRRL